MPFDVRRLVSLGRVSSVAVSPDGTHAVCAVSRLNVAEGDAEGAGSKYVSDLWRVSLEPSPSPGAPIQLTRGKHNDRAPCFRRDGALGFLTNRPVNGQGLASRGAQDDDDEARDQVWVLPGEGDPYPLTDEALGVDAFRFAPGGDLLVVVTDVLAGVAPSDQRARAKDLEKNGPSDLHYGNRFGPFRHWDHWLGRARPHIVAYDDRGGSRRDLTPDASREYTGDLAFAVSHHGAWIAAIERVESDDRLFDPSIRLIDTKDGSSRMIAHGPHLEHSHPLFSRDATHLYFNRQRRSKERHGKVELCMADVTSGATTVLCEAWDRWPTPQAAFNGDDGGDRVIATADDDGCVPVYCINPRENAFVRVTAAEHGGSHDSLSVTDDGRIVGIRHGLLAPPNPFMVRAQKDQAPALLAELTGFDPKEVASIEVSQFDTKARDGERIQTWLVQGPRGAGAGLPTVLWIHGGPVGAFGDGWHWRWNPLVLASAGYAIALPNARGSTGFGTPFVDGIWRNSWGGACYDDLMRVTDALEKRPGLDPKRFAAMGGSFGGYMCNFIGGKTTRFRALVTHASVYHLEAMCGASDYGPYFSIEMGTTSWEDRAEFEKHSPHRGVGAWKTPTLVIHGEKDYRVPISEALILFDALQEHNVESELVVFPDENHWILRPRNVEAWYTHVARFLAKHV
jgi:dipeptidyl aminopeptidase/acylaminoacyl peptidase